MGQYGEWHLTLPLCSGSLLQDPKLTRLVTKLQLSLASLLTVSPSLLAQVAAYTITARLAPHWNKVTSDEIAQ